MNFRNDINGLRALAVAVVLLFHFHTPGFSGGFIGVDVFFVISGYLMTQIVTTRITQQRFSLLDFYIDRGKRILPALAFLTLIVMAVGAFILLPSEYAALGKHAAGAVSFTSNMVFWSEAGYFDSNSHEKWLLHTWSLSVEWQFYILYPVGILAIAKLAGLRHLKWLLFAATLLSLALSAYASIKVPSAAFYLLPTRAWEMMAGGLVFLFAPSIHLTSTASRLAQYAGLVLIAASVALFDENTVWPGYLAMTPVLGAALVLIANHQESLLARNREIQLVGAWSYSIYLWHWPIAVAITYYELWSAASTLAAIIASIILGYLSYKYIETPVRDWKAAKHPADKRSLLFLLSAMTIATSLIGMTVALMHGFPDRVNKAAQIADAEATNRSPYRSKCFPEKGTKSPQCHFGSREKVDFIILGDSHSLSLLGAAISAAEENKKGLLFLGYSGCPAILGVVKKDRPECNTYNRKTLQMMQSEKWSKTPVIVINRYPNFSAPGNGDEIRTFFQDKTGATASDIKSGFKENFINTMCTLSSGRDVYVTLPIPQFDIPVASEMAHQLKSNPDTGDLYIDQNKYLARNNFTISVIREAQKECGIHVIETTPYLCRESKCYGSKNGRPLYYDNHHLSEYGNHDFIPAFEKLMKKAI